MSVLFSAILKKKNHINGEFKQTKKKEKKKRNALKDEIPTPNQLI